MIEKRHHRSNPFGKWNGSNVCIYVEYIYMYFFYTEPLPWLLLTIRFIFTSFYHCPSLFSIFSIGIGSSEFGRRAFDHFPGWFCNAVYNKKQIPNWLSSIADFLTRYQCTVANAGKSVGFFLCVVDTILKFQSFRVFFLLVFVIGWFNWFWWFSSTDSHHC